MDRRGESDTESIARAFAALGGERFPLDDGASKVLRFMLESSEGCDAVISRTSFEIRFGWHPSRHRYFLHLAAPVVGELLRLAGTPLASSERVRLRIGPAIIQVVQFPSWSFGERLVWLVRSPDAISICIRDGGGDQLSIPESPSALPDPIAYRRQFVDFPSALACPRCSVLAQNYRQLTGGALLCAACGRSFVLGDLPP